MTIRVVAAACHPIVNVGISEVLRQHDDIELVGTASDSGQILDLITDHLCDVLVTDSQAIQMRQGCCQSVIPLVRRRCPELRIVAHGSMTNPAQLGAMARLGIEVVVHPNDTVPHLAEAINAAYFKARYLSPSLAHRQTVSPQRKGTDGTDGTDRALTRREREVLALLLSGRTVCEVASAVHRCKQTISAHKARAMRKLGLKKDTELFRLAYEDGFLAFCLSPQPGDRLCIRACGAHQPAAGR